MELKILISARMWCREAYCGSPCRKYWFFVLLPWRATRALPTFSTFFF